MHKISNDSTFMRLTREREIEERATEQKVGEDEDREQLAEGSVCGS